jgi:hypothetical protein
MSGRAQEQGPASDIRTDSCPPGDAGSASGLTSQLCARLDPVRAVAVTIKSRGGLAPSTIAVDHRPGPPARNPPPVRAASTLSRSSTPRLSAAPRRRFPEHLTDLLYKPGRRWLVTYVDRPERLAQSSGQLLAHAHPQRGVSDAAGASHVQDTCALLLQQTKHFSGAILEPNGFDHLWLHSCQRRPPTGLMQSSDLRSPSRETSCNAPTEQPAKPEFPCRSRRSMTDHALPRIFEKLSTHIRGSTPMDKFLYMPTDFDLKTAPFGV